MTERDQLDWSKWPEEELRDILPKNNAELFSFLQKLPGPQDKWRKEEDE